MPCTSSPVTFQVWPDLRWYSSKIWCFFQGWIFHIHPICKHLNSHSTITAYQLLIFFQNSIFPNQPSFDHLNSHSTITTYQLLYQLYIYKWPTCWRTPASVLISYPTHPSLKFLCHSRTCACDTMFSSYTCSNISRARNGVLPNRTINFTFILFLSAERPEKEWR